MASKGRKLPPRTAADWRSAQAEWAVDLIRILDAALPQLPKPEDAQYFEPHVRVLVESVRKRAAELCRRMEELQQAEAQTVDALRAW